MAVPAAVQHAVVQSLPVTEMIRAAETFKRLFKRLNYLSHKEDKMEEKLEQRVSSVSGVVSEAVAKAESVLGRYAYWSKKNQSVKLAYASGSLCYGGPNFCTSCSNDQ